MFRMLHRRFDQMLQVFSIALLLGLAFVVVIAVIFRFAGSSLVWYDEVASVLLAWLTYYGAALAALRRSHLGFGGLFVNFPKNVRAVSFVFAELFVIAFFGLVGWAGYHLLEVFGEETLVSLPWIRLSFTQSVVPIGAVLFILAELFSIPDAWQKAIAGLDFEKQAIDEAIEDAKQT